MAGRPIKSVSKINRYKRLWYRENREKVLGYNFKFLYGISIAERDARRQEQNNRCAICTEEMTTPHIDHDHVTGQFRGLLCSSCNLMLGHSKEKVSRLSNAIAYLEKFSK